MSSDAKQAFNAVVQVYETWRDKRGISRQERSLPWELPTFIHEMGWTSSVQDELEQRSRGGR